MADKTQRIFVELKAERKRCMEDYYKRYDDWVDECKKLTKEDWKPPEPLGKDDIRRERSQFRHVSRQPAANHHCGPAQNLAFTREILRLSDQHRCVINRFSILTLRMLDAVHAAFSAEELMGVELVLQNRESLMPKAVVGRATERQPRGELGETGKAPLFEPDQATIACVSGFLVNMVNRSIQLVTPARCSERWPLGCRVLGERRFGAAPEFRAAIEGLIDTHMPEEIGSADVLGFRDDLTYHRNPNGFELRTRNGHFALGGFPGAGRLGDMIHGGGMTAGEYPGRGDAQRSRYLCRGGRDATAVRSRAPQRGSQAGGHRIGGGAYGNTRSRHLCVFGVRNIWRRR